jgi:hypothetical protein
LTVRRVKKDDFKMTDGGVTSAMTRRTILILGTISVASLVLGVMVPGTSLAFTSNIPSAILTVCAVLLALGCLAGAAAWTIALIHSAAAGKWGWFVAILIFNVLGSLAYSLRSDVQSLHAIPALTL